MIFSRSERETVKIGANFLNGYLFPNFNLNPENRKCGVIGKAYSFCFLGLAPVDYPDSRPDVQTLLFQVFLYLSNAQNAIVENRSGEQDLSSSLNHTLIEMLQSSCPTRSNHG